MSTHRLKKKRKIKTDVFIVCLFMGTHALMQLSACGSDLFTKYQGRPSSKQGAGQGRGRGRAGQGRGRKVAWNNLH